METTMPPIKTKPAAQPRKPVNQNLSSVNGRPIIYTMEDIVLYGGRGPKSKPPLTQKQLKEMIGWSEEPADEDWEDNYLLRDGWGKKIRGINNAFNRKFDMGWSLRLMQDHLTGSYRLNGETIIIGETALVLSGQHRIISAILADQVRLGAKIAMKGDQSEYWREYWPTEVTLSSAVTYGVSEDEGTTRTLDNVKPRSFADVLFCRPDAFGPNVKSAAERGQYAKVTDSAVKMLWHRTGQVSNPFASRRTHSEALDFVNRHPKIKNCVAHIMKEDPKNTLVKVIGRGGAAAMMYLMGCSATDDDVVETYHSPLTVKEEKGLDWSRLDKAKEFWTLYLKEDGTFQRVRLNIARLVNKNDPTMAVPMQAKLAVIAKAWLLFVDGADFSDSDVMDAELDLKSHWVKDKNDVWRFTDTPTVDGIDIGDPAEKEPDVTDGGVDADDAGGQDAQDDEGDDPDPPDAQTIAEAAAEQRRVRAAEVDARLKELAAKGPKPKPLSPVRPPSTKTPLRGGNVSAAAPLQIPSKAREGETGTIDASLLNVYCGKCREQEADDWGCQLKDGDSRHEQSMSRAGCDHAPYKEREPQGDAPPAVLPPKRKPVVRKS